MRDLKSYGKDFLEAVRGTGMLVGTPIGISVAEGAALALKKFRDERTHDYRRILRHESGHALGVAISSGDGVYLGDFKVGRALTATHRHWGNIFEEAQFHLQHTSKLLNTFKRQLTDDHPEILKQEGTGILDGVAGLLPSDIYSGMVTIHNHPSSPTHDQNNIVVSLGGPAAETQKDWNHAKNKLINFMSGKTANPDFLSPYWSVNQLGMEKGHDLSDYEIRRIVNIIHCNMDLLFRAHPFQGALLATERHIAATHDLQYIKSVASDIALTITFLMQAPLQTFTSYPNEIWGQVTIMQQRMRNETHDRFMESLKKAGYSSEALVEMKQRLHKIIDSAVKETATV